MSFLQSDHIIARALRRLREAAKLIWVLNTKLIRGSRKAHRRLRKKADGKTRTILSVLNIYRFLGVLLVIKVLIILFHYFNTAWFAEPTQSPVLTSQEIEQSTSPTPEETLSASGDETASDEAPLSPSTEHHSAPSPLHTPSDSAAPDSPPQSSIVSDEEAAPSAQPQEHAPPTPKKERKHADKDSIQGLTNPKPFTRQPYLHAGIPDFMRTINPQYFIEAAPNQEIQVAILVTNLSLNSARTQELYAVLPPSIGFILSPYRLDLTEMIYALKTEGHPVVMSLPMEDEDPYTDQGYLTLRATLPPEKNQEHLREILSRGQHVDAFFGESGARLMKAHSALKNIFSMLQKKSVSFIAPPDVMMTRVHEAAQETGLNYITATVLNPLPEQIPLVESLAKRTGYAIVIFEDHPHLEESLYTWIHALESVGIHIVPLTELIHSAQKESLPMKDMAA